MKKVYFQPLAITPERTVKQTDVRIFNFISHFKTKHLWANIKLITYRILDIRTDCNFFSWLFKIRHRVIKKPYNPRENIFSSKKKKNLN